MKKKKIILFIIAALAFNFIVLNNTNIALFATDASALCEEEGVIKAFRVLAYVIKILQVLAPSIIIVTGIVNGAKALMTEEDGGAKKIATELIQKVIIACFIFFIPVIVRAMMHYANGYDQTEAQFTKCGECLNDVNYCDQLLK